MSYGRICILCVGELFSNYRVPSGPAGKYRDLQLKKSLARSSVEVGKAQGQILRIIRLPR